MRFTLALLLTALGTSGCAHYSIPVGELESPEALGKGQTASMDLVGMLGGPDLIALSVQPAKDASDPQATTPKPRLQNNYTNPYFGFYVPVSDRIDIGVRLAPFSPNQARIKVQLAGAPQEQAMRGNFSAAFVAGAGLLLGNVVQSTSQTESTTLLTFSGAFLGGYRLWDHHLFSGGPSARYATLSGPSSIAGSGTVFGGHLQYQYDAESLLFKLEATGFTGGYTRQNSELDLKGIVGGISLGFRL